MKVTFEINDCEAKTIMSILKRADINFTFSTSDDCDYVDLGLPSGLKWAKCNVGATKPTECGMYFRWGEVEDARIAAKGEYNYDKPFKDAATYHMGKEWRMPTIEDFEELVKYTTTEWTTENGVYGRKFVSKTDASKYIFFPPSGYFDDGSFGNGGSYGFYWSSPLYSSSPNSAYYLHFYSGNVFPRNNNNRYFGFSVRGVRK